VGRHGNIGWIIPLEFLSRGAFPGDVADFKKDLSAQVGLIDATAKAAILAVLARVFSEVEEFLAILLAPVKAMGRLDHLLRRVAYFVCEIIAPGFQEISRRIENRHRRAG